MFHRSRSSGPENKPEKFWEGFKLAAAEVLSPPSPPPWCSSWKVLKNSQIWPQLEPWKPCSRGSSKKLLGNWTLQSKQRVRTGLLTGLSVEPSRRSARDANWLLEVKLAAEKTNKRAGSWAGDITGARVMSWELPPLQTRLTRSDTL